MFYCKSANKVDCCRQCRLIILWLVLNRERGPNAPKFVEVPTPTPPPLALPLAVIDIHTSTDSFSRISQFRHRFYENDSFIANDSFVFRVVVAHGADVPTDV
jgi:hypothetical protein